MSELVDEHKYTRQVVGELVQAKKHYLEGRLESLQTIKKKLTMLQEFWEFDQRMIHDKYRSVVEHLRLGENSQHCPKRKN
jgi:hypothetical protein